MTQKVLKKPQAQAKLPSQKRVESLGSGDTQKKLGEGNKDKK